MSAVAPPASGELTKDQLLEAYRVMRTIREFEERLHTEFATGEIPGFVHLYAGEEAIAAGVCAHLGADDYVASTHRGHGHSIAKGCDVAAMMAEIYGKQDGICHGKGGSMHIADLSKGHARRQRHRRRRPAARVRRRPDREGQGLKPGGGLLHRRRRLQPGHVPREPQPRRRVAPARRLRGREQRLRGVDVAQLPPERRRPDQARRRLRPARHQRRRLRLLRRPRGRRRGHRARPLGRRCLAHRVQGHALLRPLRGRPADLPRPRRGRRAAAHARLPGRLLAARDRGRTGRRATDLAAIDASVAKLIDDAVAQAKAADDPTPDEVLTDVYLSY